MKKFIIAAGILITVIGLNHNVKTQSQIVQGAKNSSITFTGWQLVPVVWPVSFVDATYTVSCSVEENSGLWTSSSMTIRGMRNITPTGLNIILGNPSSPAKVGIVHCIGVGF